jgi:hypothetical protein
MITQCQYLHLGALVLEPELDLERLQAQLPAQLLPLLVIRVWELLEEAASSMHLQQYQILKRKKSACITSYCIENLR